MGDNNRILRIQSSEEMKFRKGLFVKSMEQIAIAMKKIAQDATQEGARLEFKYRHPTTLKTHDLIVLIRDRVAAEPKILGAGPKVDELDADKTPAEAMPVDAPEDLPSIEDIQQELGGASKEDAEKTLIFEWKKACKAKLEFEQLFAHLGIKPE